VNTRPIENIIISIYLGENVSHVSATPSGDSRGIGSGNTGGTVLGCVGGGTWEFDPNKKARHFGLLEMSRQKLTLGIFFSDSEMVNILVDLDREVSIISWIFLYQVRLAFLSLTFC
jgi:AP-3 complex subunit mu